MPGTVGSGLYTYELVEGWGALPDGWSYYEVVGVAVDSRQHVHVFNRGEHPVIVFDSDGNFLRAWGEGFFARPHGICIGPDDAVYCVDDLGHTVHRFSPHGALLLTLGVRGAHSDTGYTDEAPKVLRGAGPFHGPTNVAVAPDGSFYVSDGYRNARVHKFASDGAGCSCRGASLGPVLDSSCCPTGLPLVTTARSMSATARTIAFSCLALTAITGPSGGA